MKKYILAVLFILFIASCSGMLWNGTADNDSTNLTISIDNPFYQGGETGTSSSSRALALQGNYLYIELARIDDQVAYDADSDKLITGNGTWIETLWGGHGILTFDLTNWVDTLEATFKDVPRGQDLQARVYLDYDEPNIIAGLNGDYLNEALPMCHTYNPAGTDNIEKSWVTVSFTELAEGVVSLPIRPETITSHNNGLFILEIFSDQVPEEYIDQITQPGTETEPAIGETKFRRFEVDIDSDGSYLKDLAFYIMTDVELPVGAALPGITALYDSEGAVAVDRGGDSFTLTPTYPYRYFYIVYPELDGNYYNDDFFIGSTLFPGIELVDDGVNYVYGVHKYDVGFGVLYDDDFNQFSTGDNYLRWELPSGFVPGDLEFKLLFIEGISQLTDQEWETIDQINALNPVVMSDWSANPAPYTTYFDFDTTAWTNSSWAGDHAVVLARIPGGQAFIFVRSYFGGA